jgi:hypothetical protein
VGDEVLTGASLLVGVAPAGEDEGPLDRRPVDLGPGIRRMLTGDREQIAEQRPLLVAEVLGDLVQRRSRNIARVLDADPRVAGRVEATRIEAPIVLEPALVGR